MHDGPHPGRLIIVCGLPGSGKTTYAKRLESQLRAIRFCPDEWMEVLGLNLHQSKERERIEALQWKFTQQLLALGQTVIIEWGTWGRSERDSLRLGARKLGAAVELHLLEAEPVVLFERIRLRNQEEPAIKYDDVLTWTKIFEPPSAEEVSLFDKPSKIVE